MIFIIAIIEGEPKSISRKGVDYEGIGKRGGKVSVRKIKWNIEGGLVRLNAILFQDATHITFGV